MSDSLKFSKADVDRAGVVLSGKMIPTMSQEKAFKILENFRSIHIHPMMVFRKSLKWKLRNSSTNALISQRLKRAPSVIRKLKIEKQMSLTQMQDIGGLRVVLNSLSEVYRLRDSIRDGEKQIAFKSTFLKEKDYIREPKASGYRSIHLVYKYEKNVPKDRQCRVEIQIRTKNQHAWATAVEVIGTYLSQPLKQSFGDEKILELFKLISKAFIVIENKETDIELFKTVSSSIEELKLRDLLKGFATATKIVDESNKKKTGKYFLIKLNFRDKTLSYRRYTESGLEKANKEYADFEKMIINDKNSEVVLVSVDSIANLQKLYPNYFLDTNEFVNLLDKIDDEIKRASL